MSDWFPICVRIAHGTRHSGPPGQRPGLSDDEDCRRDTPTCPAGGAECPPMVTGRRRLARRCSRPTSRFSARRRYVSFANDQFHTVTSSLSRVTQYAVPSDSAFGGRSSNGTGHRHCSRFPNYCQCLRQHSRRQLHIRR